MSAPSSAPSKSAARGTTPDGAVIEVRVHELSQLFHSLDPSPFHERALDVDAEEFIVGIAQELPRERPIQLIVYVDVPGTSDEERDIVAAAIRAHFARRAQTSALRLRQLLRQGRKILLIGVLFLAASLVGSELIARRMGNVEPLAIVFRESLIISGWVAMWRPMEIFLYDWWPIRAEGAVFERLSQAGVRIVHRPDPR